MTKLDPEGHLLEKPSSIWITIASLIVTFAVALAFLQAGEMANAQNVSDLKVDYASINTKLDLLNQKLNDNAVSQAEMKTDLVYIKQALNKIK